MNIYCIRDKLIDYYMPPFVAENYKAVYASIANIVNDEDRKDVIAKTPSHFEIWQLATLDNQGNVTADKQFLADCSSFVRGSIRKEPTQQSSSGALHSTTPESQPGPAHSSKYAVPGKHAPTAAMEPEEAQTDPSHRAPPGAHRGT